MKTARHAYCNRCFRPWVFALALLSAALVPGLRAEAQRLDTIPFFKESIGIWKGKGTSVAGPQQSKLEVSDEWKASFEKDGTVFVQVGKVTLSNGASFQYRWVYQFDPKTQTLLALHTDSNRARSLHAVELEAGGSKISVAPVEGDGQKRTAGLFSKVRLKEGRQIYDAEVRDQTGQADIKTTVTSVKESAGAAP